MEKDTSGTRNGTETESTYAERLPTYKKCFFCGRDSHGLHLKIAYKDGICSCEFVTDGAFQGYRGVAHGGIVSGVLDELMWWTILVETGAMCFTWKMDIEFRRPVMCSETYRAVGSYQGVRHGNYQVSASIEDASGKVCAKAVGVFRKVKDMSNEELFRNLDFSESSGCMESLLRSRMLEKD